LAGLLGLLGGASIGVILSRRKGRYTTLSTALGLSLFSGLMAHHLSAWIDWPRSTAEWVMGGVTPLLMMLVATRTFSKARRNRALDAALLFALAVGALTLCFDARYRILPWSMVAAAAVLAWWPLFNEADHRSPSPLAVGWSPATRLMGLGLGVAALTLPVLEGPQNTQAWGVALGWAALAVSAVAAMIKHHRLGSNQPNATAVR
jgi:multisubunit Na+/H+ antiporter MnhB subunit